MVAKLDKIFNSFVENRIFKNKGVLQTSYTPDTIPHRDKQIEAVASILAPSLRGERVSNLFCFGKTGTGKTLSVQYVTNEILKRIKESGGDNLRVVYVNCKLKKVADTEYRILAEIISSLGESVHSTGLPTGAVYSKFVEIIERKKQLILIVLDEIDQAVKKIGDNFLYTLTRLNSELKNSQISIVGISNSLTFMDNIDPRVRSSLGEEELVFPPYNALQLQDILRERTEDAFSEGVLQEGVIAKCAAFAAREHGDARRALDLLRVAGEIAERESLDKLNLDCIDKANNKIERDKMIDIIENEPKQHQLVLYSIMHLSKDKNYDKIFTGNVYNRYQELCQRTKNDILTQRRISDIIAEFDMLGLINVDVISRGRKGRTREIKMMLPETIKTKAEEILITSLML
ncbi:MAG: orc1/cdc6 family replication initiation protein [Candidatus Pacearchaeota archaeon]|nr:orc1/cdc6 family replication initiation protein [Candidatus Pacearchaeota archaeon]